MLISLYIMQTTAIQCVVACTLTLTLSHLFETSRAGRLHQRGRLRTTFVQTRSCPRHLKNIPKTAQSLHGCFSFILCLSYRTQALAADTDCTKQNGHALRLADHNIAHHLYDSNTRCLKYSIAPFNHLQDLSKGDGQHTISPTSLSKKASLSE